VPRSLAFLLLLSLLIVAPGCRCAGPPPVPSPLASAASSTPPLASLSTPPAVLSAPLPPRALSSPWSAARLAEDWLAAGISREGGGILVLRGNSEGIKDDLALPSPPELGRLASLDLVASKGGIALHAEDRNGKGSLWRAASWEGLRSAAPEPHTAALCALEDHLFGVVNGPPPQLRSWSFAGGEPTTVADLKESGATSLYCGVTRAYLLVDDGKNRRLFAADAQGLRGPASLDGKDEERGLTFATEQDTLWIGKLDASGRPALRRWPAASAAPEPWVTLDERVEEGSSLDLMVIHPSTPALAALVIDRHTDAEDCKNGENFHTVAELLVFDLEKRSMVRGKARLDSWLCGAEAGPFGGGASERGFVVTWPRGVGANCAKQGARNGGLAFLEAPVEGAVRGGKVDVPSQDLLDLGCEGGKCGAVALPRGDGAECWESNDERSNVPRWLAYP
jgi:hypothetical protein